jgi:hypothetical protein
MSALEVLHQLARLGVMVRPTDDGYLDLEPEENVTPEVLETVKAHKSELLEHLTAKSEPQTLERLPWQLETMIRTAANAALPAGTITLESGLTPDLNRYVLSWAVSYLLGAAPDAHERLWIARRAWEPFLIRELN